MNCSTPGSSVLYCLLEFGQIHVHLIGDALLGPEAGVTERLLHIFQHRTSPINSPLKVTTKLLQDGLNGKSPA